MRSTAGRMAAATALVAGLVAVPTMAVGQTASEAGDYSGSADSSIIDLTVGDFSGTDLGLTLAEGAIAPTEVVVDTQDGLEFHGEDGRTAGARGTNVDGTLADELEAQGLLVEALQTAPPDNEEPAEEQLAEVPADPLLHTDLATADALARDAAENACPDDGVVAEANSTVQNTRLGTEQLDGEDFARIDQTAESHSDVSLVDVDGQSTKAVQSTADADLQSIELGGGADNDGLDIDIVSPPTLVATATGTPGTASVEYSAPIFQINGEGFDAADEPQDIPIGDEELGFIARVQLGQSEQSVSDDGTSASASATAIEITILQSLAEDSEFTIAQIDVAPMSVEAEAPQGGVVCAAADQRLDVTKDVDQDPVQPGDTFTYTIDVSNPLDCTVTNRAVVDEITGPDGFEVTETDPDGADVEQDGDTATVTFDDLPDLEPGDSHSVSITVEVPDGASGTFSDEVVADGDCDGDDVTGDDQLDGPAIVDVGADVQPAPEPQDDESMPETGGGTTAALLGMLAIGTGLLLRRRLTA